MCVCACVKGGEGGILIRISFHTFRIWEVENNIIFCCIHNIRRLLLSILIIIELQNAIAWARIELCYNNLDLQSCEGHRGTQIP